MKKLFLAAGVGVAVAFAGWRLLVKKSGDPDFRVAADRFADVSRDGLTFSGSVDIVNRGTTLGVVRRVDGKIVEGGTGRVYTKRRGSEPPERGWWVPDVLDVGQTFVAEVEVEVDGEPSGPLTIELTIQQLGRRLFEYHSARVVLPTAVS